MKDYDELTMDELENVTANTRIPELNKSLETLKERITKLKGMIHNIETSPDYSISKNKQSDVKDLKADLTKAIETYSSLERELTKIKAENIPYANKSHGGR